ncbi:MAG: T9SS type A sorting domain-containing protein [Muribaculaceae bacterium]|nr:T9SS type A sorting domain-containing protein [Muribaculaceae bacterium]
MKQISFIITFFALSIVSSNANEYSLTKELNMPRNGDKPTYHVIDFISFNDTSNVWDYSATQISDVAIVNKYSFYGDTLLSRFNGENTTYRIIEDSLLCANVASQGKLLNFNRAELIKKFPMVANSTYGEHFYSEGTIDHNRYLRQSGISTTHVKKGKLIIPDGDSLQNVLLVKNIRYGSTIINRDYSNSFCLSNDSSIISTDSIMWHLANDSITFCQEINQWYARGYRYPIIETRKVKSFYYNNPIDSISIAYYCSPYSQAHDLASDPLNEELRLDDATNVFQSNFGDIANTKSLNSFSNNSFSPNNDENFASSLAYDENCNIKLNETSNNININYSSQPDCIVAVTLHNSAGALMWQTSEVARDSQGDISYPTHDLVAGEYLVTVFLKNSQYSFKFIKK